MIVPSPSGVGTRLSASGSFVQGDAELGYATRAGVYDFKIHLSDSTSHTFSISIEEDGGRALAVDRPSARPLLLIGCSYAFGWPLSDDAVVGSILQERLGNLAAVKTYACTGYSNVHSLLQLRKRLSQLSSLHVGDVIVFYNSFHRVRNIAFWSWINTFRVFPGFYRDLYYPRAMLARNGQLAIDYVPMVGNTPSDICKEYEKWDVEYSELVTMRIFQVIRELVRDAGFRLAIATQRVNPDDAVLTYFIREGFTVVDLSVPHEWSCLPFDLHPNARAHKSWASTLNAYLSSARHA